MKFQFGDDFKQPGTRTSIRVTASPNSLCGLKVVDKSVTLMTSDDQFTRDKVSFWGYNVFLNRNTTEINFYYLTIK